MVLLFAFGDKLCMVIELFRHGARGPDKKLDYFTNITWPVPEEYGELTRIGIRQHYLLGRYIKAKYVDTNFISSTYNSSQVYAQSTDMNRTLLSAYYQLAGIFNNPQILSDSQLINAHPPTDINQDVQNLLGNMATANGYSPFIIHSMNRATDIAFSPTDACPRYNAMYSQSPETQQFIDFVNNEYTKYSTYFINYYSLDAATVNKPKNAKPFADNILSAYYNYMLPADINVTAVEGITMCHSILLNFSASGNITALILSSSNLLSMLHTNMSSKIEEVISGIITSPSLRLYAMHDTNLAPLINIFGITYPQSPTILFASNLFFELTSIDQPKTEKDFSVNIIYNGNVVKKLAYHDFKTLCNTYITNSWEKDCKW